MRSTISKAPVISWKWVKTYFLEITGFAGFTGTFCGFPEHDLKACILVLVKVINWYGQKL